MPNLFSVSNLINKVKKWYQGEWIENDHPVLLTPMFRKRTLLAKTFNALGKFWLKHWKWLITTLVAVVGLIITLIKLDTT